MEMEFTIHKIKYIMKYGIMELGFNFLLMNIKKINNKNKLSHLIIKVSIYCNKVMFNKIQILKIQINLKKKIWI